MESPDLIMVNSYIIIQRHGYFKLHQLASNSSVMLGKDKVNLSLVIGKPYWSLFKMSPSKGKKREFDLEECSKAENISAEIMKVVSYGTDNRNITDDGSSQALSSEEINGMRDEGMSGHKILGKLVENSKTFKEKTEFSQEKYLKKKEKKYFEYIIIRKPTLRLLADIFYSKDQLKIMGLRHDTLSQILTGANIQHDGVYALFENSSQALVGASILSYISCAGLLVNLNVGSNPQKQAILAMNFKKENLDQLINVRIKDFFKALQPNIEISCLESEVKSSPNVINNTVGDEASPSEPSEVEAPTQVAAITSGEVASPPNGIGNKRKCPDTTLDGDQPPKKPRWAEDLGRAVEAFRTRKLNGIIIVAKEYPLNIIEELLPHLKPSCQLVVYCGFREPLIQLYIELKKRRDVIGIHVTDNWLRPYQVLPERTHPKVNMSFSGHLLIGTKVI